MSPVVSPYFRISFRKSRKTITITMRVIQEEVTTTRMPYISMLLKKELPTILRSKCFNENNIPFSQEVHSTELGHLFEHILLEYLCIAKIGFGSKEAIFSGITKWDWNKDPYGTFHITLDMEREDMIFLNPAMQKTIHLFEKILVYPQIPFYTKQFANNQRSNFLE